MSKIPPYPWRIKNLNVFEKIQEINIWNFALQKHYKKNSHHPQFFPSLSQMNDLNKKHMLCDLLGSQLGSQWKFGLRWSIPQAANICKTWSNWNIVEGFYTGPFEEPPLGNSRWPKDKSDSEKFQFVLWVKCLLHEKISFDDFMTGLYAFKCVEEYMLDLQWHQYAVLYVGRELFPNDKELINELEIHDNDKLDAFMIAAYVLKWIFDVETIEITEHFKNIRIDGFIYDIIYKGRQNINE